MQTQDVGVCIWSYLIAIKILYEAGMLGQGPRKGRQHFCLYLSVLSAIFSSKDKQLGNI